MNGLDGEYEALRDLTLAEWKEARRIAKEYPRLSRMEIAAYVASDPLVAVAVCALRGNPNLGPFARPPFRGVSGGRVLPRLEPVARPRLRLVQGGIR